MKFCYFDESGSVANDYSVMAGVLVDASRMHVTKSHWDELLGLLSDIVGRPVREFHTRKFYAGQRQWRALAGDIRANIISAVINWVGERRHHIVYSAIDTAAFNRGFAAHRFSGDVGSHWRLMALHTALSLQRCNQREQRNKGNTVLVFDNKETEQTEYSRLLLNPPVWTESFYNRRPADRPLNQIIDVPHFVDSEHVGLIQVADLVAFTLRRYLEITEGGDGERYDGERARIEAWTEQILERSIGRSFIYPRRNRCDAADYFCEFSPACLR